MHKGLFLVLEGGGGSGKSSCMEFLKQRLPRDRVLFTREPGGTDVGEELRETLLRSGRRDPLNPLEQTLGMEMARSHHARTLITPALERGVHVISDRFSASTYAYQVHASEEAPWINNLFRVLEMHTTRNARPDFWIFLSVPAVVGMHRRERSGTGDVFDGKKIAFQERVREGTRMYLKGLPHLEIDATAPLSEVQEEVLSKVKEILGL